MVMSRSGTLIPDSEFRGICGYPRMFEGKRDLFDIFSVAAPDLPRTEPFCVAARPKDVYAHDCTI
jgi:hypothetical protein